MAQDPVAGPLAELDLGDQLGADVVGKSLDGPRWRWVER
jgi:hypothetical protein